MHPLQITRIPILPLGMVTAHLVHGPGGAILVDAGLPDTERAIARALRRLGLQWQDIRLIVITHAHIDHAGNAARLRALTGAPVCAHVGDLPHYLQKAPMTFCPSGSFGRFFLMTGLIQRAYQAFTPDILLGDGQTLDLAPFGVAGLVRHSAGHTAGSLSVELADGSALVGDLVASGILLGGLVLTGRAKSPPFEQAPAQVGRELLRLVEAGHQRFLLGHGGPLPAAEVQRHAHRLLRRHAPGMAL